MSQLAGGVGEASSEWRPGKLLRTLQVQDGPHHKHHPAQNVGHAELEKPWFRLILCIFRFPLGSPKDVTHALRGAVPRMWH